MRNFGHPLGLGGLLLALVLAGALLLRGGTFRGRAGTGHTPEAETEDGRQPRTDAVRITAIPSKPEDSHGRLAPARPRGRHTTTGSVQAAASETDSATTEPRTSEQYLEALLALQQQEGRDNAMLHYVLATEMAPGLPDDRQKLLIDAVLAGGWDDRALPLLPYLQEWQAALDELHTGAALDYARGIGFEQGPQTPVPNFLHLQNAAKMLAVHGRYLESLGRHEEARKQYLTAATLGRDLGGPGNLAISSMVGAAITNVATRQLARAADSGQMSGDVLRSTAARLQEVSGSWAPFRTQVEAEQAAIHSSLVLDQKDPAAAQDSRRFLQETVDYFSQARWQRDGKPGWSESIPDSIRSALPDFPGMEVRHSLALSRLNQTILRTALAAWRAEQGSYPARLEDLAGRRYLSTVPGDPFSGTPFQYRPGEGGYELFGSGPVTDAATAPAGTRTYDPRNGAESEGVIRIESEGAR